MRMLIPLLLAGGLLAADDPEARSLPAGAGQEVVAKICLRCHGAGNFRQKRLDKDGWEDKVADMVDRGAAISDKESAVIVAYLTRTFGPGARINVNTAPFAEIKAILALTPKETQAFLDFRQQKGGFKAMAELGKIPGVPAEKIEAKKDRIAF